MRWVNEVGSLYYIYIVSMAMANQMTTSIFPLPHCSASPLPHCSSLFHTPKIGLGGGGGGPPPHDNEAQSHETRSARGSIHEETASHVHSHVQ